MTPAAREHQPHLWPSAGPPAPPGTGTVRPSAGHWGRALREPPTLLPISEQSHEIFSTWFLSKFGTGIIHLCKKNPL